MTKTPLQLTARIVGAYMAHNPVATSDLPTLIRAVHFAVSSLAAGERKSRPAVAIVVSVMPDSVWLIVGSQEHMGFFDHGGPQIPAGVAKPHGRSGVHGEVFGDDTIVECPPVATRSAGLHTARKLQDLAGHSGLRGVERIERREPFGRMRRKKERHGTVRNGVVMQRLQSR